MKVLLSIKPEFAEKIFRGEKKYEYRRTLFSAIDIKTVIVYASTPIKKVIGEFEIETIFYDDVERLWKITNLFSGINKEVFTKYFFGRNQGYAIKIKKYKKYSKPLCIKSNFGVSPPQSYIYLE